MGLWGSENWTLSILFEKLTEFYWVFQINEFYCTISECHWIFQPSKRIQLSVNFRSENSRDHEGSMNITTSQHKP